MSAEAPTNAEIMAVLVGHTERFDGMDRRFDAVDKRFDAVDERFDAADQRFDRIEGKVDQLAMEVIAIKLNQGFIDRHIDDFQKWARRHEADPNAHNRDGQAA